MQKHYICHFKKYSMEQETSVSGFLLVRRFAGYIDWAVVFLFFFSGMLSTDPWVYYDSLWRIFLIISVPLFTLSFIFYRFSESYGNRIQGERSKIPPIAKEAFGTARAMFV